MQKTTPLTKPRAHKSREVAASVRELIATLEPGDRLPTVVEMERHFAVAKSTIEAAIRVLRQEGLVESRHGSGNYVLAPPASAGVTADGSKASTGTLAVMALWQNPFFRHCMDELARQAEKKELRVVCHYAQKNTKLEDALALEALRPEGYVLFNYAFAPVAAALIERGHRAVVIGVPPPGVVPNVPCVYGDHDLGGALAAQRLLRLGHRRIAFVDEFVGVDLRRMRRWQRHVQALREAGVADAERVIPTSVWYSWREDPEAVRHYFTGPDAPTGLAVWSDATAVEILYLLRQAGRRVPEEVSIIGYDNLPVSAHSHPPLDTVEAHIAVQIRQALDLLMSPLQPGFIPTAVVTPNLLCRASCARTAG